MSTQLDGRGYPVDLGGGVVLQAPGLVGQADLQTGTLGGTRGEIENATQDFQEALAQSGFRQMHAVSVVAQEVPPPAADVRSADNGEPGMVLTVPGVGDEFGQVLMLVDEQGVITWNFPDEAPGGGVDGAGGTRGGGAQTFTVSRRVATRDVDQVGEDVADAGTRGIASAIGSKLLSVLVYPLLERGIEKVADTVAKRLEDRSHPYGLRLMTPTGFTARAADPLAGAAGAEWDLLGGGRSLLLLHGTASSSHSAFSGLGEAFAPLHAAYGGRVFAFDHHTLSDGLEDNVSRLRDLLPTDRRLEVDIVAHSRGGLVARAVAGADLPVDVRRIVYVATPNDGTPLADPKHLKTYLNRVTTMLNLIPDGPWSVVTDALSGILDVVSVVGSGAVGGLSGLTTMRPDGESLASLGWLEGEGTAQYAVDVDYEPRGRILQLVRGVDGVVDSVFGGRANDIVVPSGGVASIAARQGFSIPTDRRLSLGTTNAAWHCSLFSQAAVSEQLRTWLSSGLDHG